MPGITILGTGSYSPEFALTNEKLETIMDTTDEWIMARTGIKSRCIASSDETSLSMAVTAAKGAFETTDPLKIGVVICATITPDNHTPSLACLLQRELNLPRDIMAMDINCACGGFVMALKTAHALLMGMPGRTALIMGCEILSRVMDYTDRATSILFGDGAGAAVIALNPSEELAFECGVIGDDETLAIKARYFPNNPFMPRPKDSEFAGMKMNGQEVFRFAVETCSQSVTRLLTQSNIDISKIDHFIFHQANRRILEGIVRKIKAPIEKCIINIENHGNTSSATCGILLDELNRNGAIKPGEKILMSAFGGGKIYATAIFTQGETTL